MFDILKVLSYDVGNKEVLTVKLALEEWRHWLEGAKNHLWCGQIIRTWPTFKQPNS